VTGHPGAEYLNLSEALAIVEHHRWRVSDIGLLDQSLHRPRAIVFGTELYPHLHAKAAALMDSVHRLHPLVDGNKRLSWLATVIFYRKNGVRLIAEIDDAEEFVLAVAGEHLPIEDIAAWFADRAT
jgi:death on curing protein